MIPRADGATIRVLLIDDDTDDYLITKNLFAEIPGHPFHVDWVDGYEAGLEAICRGSHDVYLLDYRLGIKDGIALLTEARGKNPNAAAIIVLTGQGEYEIDRKAIAAGASDYLEKSRLDSVLLERSIRHALLQKHYQTDLETTVAARTRELEAVNASLKTVARAREKAVDDLKEADRRKDEFLAILAHELRNPLAPIRNALTIIKLKHDSRDVLDRAVGMIDRQVLHMIRLIDELMDISRITRNKFHLVREPVRFSEVLAAAIELSQPQIEKAEVRLADRTAAGEVVLLADRLRLAQVFSNLLNNAAKYTEPGGAVEITSAVEDRVLSVSIRDTGVGIPPEQMPHLFELFTQIDRKLNRSQNGLGIGLALAHRLATMHGGTLEAASEGLGHGSTFTVKLPLDAK